ncbi:MAG TPA: CPBP family intramembrane glutamic endopeptidase [Mycobacterium sp.]|nr:CPBP family intramembrane glutamic endopeptidase [Mycobacterium sp.]
MLAAGLVGWSFVGPRIPMPWRVLAQAVGGGLLMLATSAGSGLTPPRLWSGLRVGLPTAAAITTTVAASTAVPAVRAAMSARDVPESPGGWLALHIPLGTVWAEEAAFRAALPTAAGAFGPAGARLLQAVTFGLSHIADARGAGAPVIPTVLVTGVAGWLLGWLADRSGSLAAPILVHLAINEAGAVAVLALRRRHLKPGQ